MARARRDASEDRATALRHLAADVRFLFDAPLSPESAAYARSQGSDAQHVKDLGMTRATDAHVLEHAAAEGRVLVTMDLDFPRLLALTHVSVSPGVVVLRLRPATVRAVQDALDRLLELSPKTFTNSVVVVEDDRIRVRPLPLR